MMGKMVGRFTFKHPDPSRAAGMLMPKLLAFGRAMRQQTDVSRSLNA